MNRSTLSAAVAAAFTVAAGTASALPLADYVAGADTLEFRISGASAQDIALEKAVAALCDVGTLNGASILNNSVYYCSVTPGKVVDGLATLTAVPASVNKLVLYKSSVGGSGNGVAPVATPSNIQFLNLATLAANPSYLGAAVTITSAVLPTYTMQPIVVASSLVTVNALPSAGLSDVEPSLLGASAAAIAALTRTEGAHLTFGLLVTKTLRDQLQTAQGLTPGSEVAADQPNIQASQFTALYNGSSTNFSSLGVPAAGANLALRSAGSGTTRTNNAFFGTDSGQCVLNARARRAVTSADTSGTACSAVPGANGTVIYGSGTDNVVACLANHEAAARPAIGIASLETSTSTSGPIRFVRIDGQLPTLLNVANGRYGLWASVSYNVRTAITGNDLDAANTFRSLLSNKNVIGDVNLTISQSYGAPGDFGYLTAPVAVTNVPSALPILTQAALAANLVNPFTKVSGGVQNNCQRGIKF